MAVNCTIRGCHCNVKLMSNDGDCSSLLWLLCCCLFCLPLPFTSNGFVHVCNAWWIHNGTCHCDAIISSLQSLLCCCFCSSLLQFVSNRFVHVGVTWWICTVAHHCDIGVKMENDNETPQWQWSSPPLVWSSHSSLDMVFVVASNDGNSRVHVGLFLPSSPAVVWCLIST